MAVTPVVPGESSRARFPRVREDDWCGRINHTEQTAQLVLAGLPAEDLVKNPRWAAGIAAEAAWNLSMHLNWRAQ